MVAGNKPMEIATVRITEARRRVVAGTRSSMKIRRVILTKSDLGALPQTERSLLLLLGHASNEINVLSKLILMLTRKDTPPSRIANNVEAGQVCVLLR